MHVSAKGEARRAPLASPSVLLLLVGAAVGACAAMTASAVLTCARPAPASSVAIHNTAASPAAPAAVTCIVPVFPATVLVAKARALPSCQPPPSGQDVAQVEPCCRHHQKAPVFPSVSVSVRVVTTPSGRLVGATLMSVMVFAKVAGAALTASAVLTCARPAPVSSVAIHNTAASPAAPAAVTCIVPVFPASVPH